MKVTPLRKKFGKYSPGDVFELKDKHAKLFIKVGKLAPAPESAPAPVPQPAKAMTYETRMLSAETAVEAPVQTSVPTKRTYTRRTPSNTTKD